MGNPSSSFPQTCRSVQREQDLPVPSVHRTLFLVVPAYPQHRAAGKTNAAPDMAVMASSKRTSVTASGTQWWKGAGSATRAAILSVLGAVRGTT